ncbi:tetratricopeptide repeat protein [Niveispirillum sp. KHB5.9]|uniref:tetratricopeptide repeat protein n=1 Tax=Niveispirillum sp. KHB5.9 TaxID=3400269 RepID=UPI003A8ACE0E
MKPSFRPAALALSLALLAAPPALADIQAGRIAYSAGDYATAFKEFSAAADAGDSSGQYLAGEMLMQGRGTAKDVRRGMTLLEASARGGHVGAQSMVGALHAFGQDTPADYAKALSFLRPAAEAGDMHAQNNLAALLYFGLGTKQDVVDALSWAKRASAKRLVAAIKLEKEIESQTTPDQIKAATARAGQPLAAPSPVVAAQAAPAPVTAAAPVAKPQAAPAPKPAAPANAIPVARPAPAPQPEAAPAPVASPATVQAPTPAPAGGWVIQVGSLPSREEAEKHWKGIAAKQAGLVAGRQPSLVQADLGTKGIYTRVFLTGFAAQADAAALCAKLKAAGTDCLVKKGP